jgi:glutamine synthetase
LVDHNGNPHPLDPRNILKQQVEKAHDMGYEPYMFSEIEFYIVDEASGQPIDQASYCSLPPEDKSYEFRQELGRTCKALGMEVKRIHHECGPGQNEIELDLTPCVKNADDTVLCMWILEMMAHQRQQKVVFSPKPFVDEAGNGMHHHILLRRLQTGENAFAPTQDDDRLSKTCRHGIAGLVKYADEITAVMAASPETFVRLQPGFEAPNLKTWGFSNRTALVRVPATGSVESTRFEYRGGDLSGSVHLFGAVLLAAVLKGIEEQLEPPESVEYNTEHLSKDELQEKGIDAVPLSFHHCLQVLEASDFIREAFGEEMVNHLIQRDKHLLEVQSL